ncbi:dipeptide epimerase [Jejuia spongiicola]|uniref:Dipeptide epimerase n=1 Tax=Jejuia spongiicola TaxID=2942207 RepID=A0ABT0QI14_9FLAO|nr:dipeptide epimerase [Jejuia spongiicola]
MNLKLKIRPHQLQLKHPFTTSRYTVNIQKTAIISISDGTYVGYGEATTNPYYESTIEKIEKSISIVKTIVERGFGLDPRKLWKQLEPRLKDDYFTLCAIDCAYWDLYAKQNNKPLRSFWSKLNDNTPLTNYTIGIDSISKMKAKIIEIPWPIYKIKLGTSEDVKIIKALRNVTDAVFRIDANCAWTIEETLYNAKELKLLGVEFIEQPLKANNWEDMKVLKSKSVLPIVADESCQRLEDVKLCIESFHGINIKLMKCGGITPALEMIKKAKENNLLIMAGCMTESTIGISNLVQLAPLLDYIDADGAILLKKDIAKGVSFDNGRIIFSNENGSGTSLI